VESQGPASNVLIIGTFAAQVHALTLALELGADPEKCALQDYRGLLFQASLGHWDIVSCVLSCGYFPESKYPKRKTYREFVHDYQEAEQLYRNFVRNRAWLFNRTMLFFILFYY
jgi:hypothetical protein